MKQNPYRRATHLEHQVVLRSLNQIEKAEQSIGAATTALRRLEEYGDEDLGYISANTIVQDLERAVRDLTDIIGELQSKGANPTMKSKLMR